MEKTLLFVSLALFVVGFALLALGSWSFWFRAVTNKQAWGGKTKPFLLWGTVLFVLGVAGIGTFLYITQ
jgi:NADH:ubiquinone oxidoreductase subunit 2 (subunit N)